MEQSLANATAYSFAFNGIFGNHDETPANNATIDSSLSQARRTTSGFTGLRSRQQLYRVEDERPGRNRPFPRKPFPRSMTPARRSASQHQLLDLLRLQRGHASLLGQLQQLRASGLSRTNARGLNPAYMQFRRHRWRYRRPGVKRLGGSGAPGRPLPRGGGGGGGGGGGVINKIRGEMTLKKLLSVFRICDCLGHRRLGTAQNLTTVSAANITEHQWNKACCRPALLSDY